MQVHVSGIPGEVGDDAAIITALQACGLGEDEGWTDTLVARDRKTAACRCNFLK